MNSFRFLEYAWNISRIAYRCSLIHSTKQNYVPFYITYPYNLPNAQLVPSHPKPFYLVNHSIHYSFDTNNQTLPNELFGVLHASQLGSAHVGAAWLVACTDVTRLSLCKGTLGNEIIYICSHKCRWLQCGAFHMFSAVSWGIRLIATVPYKQYSEVFIYIFATALYSTVSPLTSYCTTMNLLLPSLTHGQGTRIPPGCMWRQVDFARTVACRLGSYSSTTTENKFSFEFLTYLLNQESNY
jgi:hypothetical protein